MRTLLDSILDDYAGGGVTVTENHDVSSVDWLSGMTDPGEMLGCGAHQELRRIDGETDGEYVPRVRALINGLPADVRAKLNAMGEQAAGNRHQLDTTTGKVAVLVVGEPAWHKLGVNVSRALSWEECEAIAPQCFFTMSKRPLLYDFNGQLKESPISFALVRDDTGEQFGTVGERFKVIQPRDGFKFLNSLRGEHGAKFHTCGSIYGGRSVWVQCELPGHGFEVVRGDKVQAFATFTNPNDGSGAAWCYPTTNRIVCANTFRTAAKDRAKGLSIRHTGDVQSKLGAARDALGIAVDRIDRFREAAETMSRTKVEAVPFFHDLLDRVADVTQARAKLGAAGLARLTCEERGAAVLASFVADADFREAQEKAAQRLIDGRRELLDDMIARYESDRCGVSGIRGTAWAAFNAVTESADFRQPKRQTGTSHERLSRAFESSLNGDRDEIKQTAFELLTSGARA